MAARLIKASRRDGADDDEKAWQTSCSSGPATHVACENFNMIVVAQHPLIPPDPILGTTIHARIISTTYIRYLLGTVMAQKQK